MRFICCICFFCDVHHSLLSTTGQHFGAVLGAFEQKNKQKWDTKWTAENVLMQNNNSTKGTENYTV